MREEEVRLELRGDLLMPGEFPPVVRGDRLDLKRR
jgi:hypothetical protein